jgi:hypothetical protein
MTQLKKFCPGYYLSKILMLFSLRQRSFLKEVALAKNRF